MTVKKHLSIFKYRFNPFLLGKLPLFSYSFLSNCVFKVCVDNTYSTVRPQEMGVPQSSILSVTLFSMKMNTIVSCLLPGVNACLYVGDFLICYLAENMCTVERRLQRMFRLTSLLFIIDV